MDSVMKYKTKRELITCFVIAAFGFLGGFYFGRNSPRKHDEIEILRSIQISPSIQENVSVRRPIREIERNGIEYNFTMTVRNCLGPECYDSRPAKSTIDRVGILALPGSGVQALLAVLRKAARNTALKFELEMDTHVPAYGYGKNHGWNRIVRVSRRLNNHAYALLRNLYPRHSNNASSSIPVAAFERQVRQLTRWHCRLSHVAAHTKMLTIFLEDVYTKPVVELERMITFIGVPMLRPELFKAVAEMDMHTFYRDEEELPNYLRSAGLRVLEEEMVDTHGLTDWPCRSFRDLDQGTDPLPFYSKDLAANCSNPMVKCTVGFDHREQPAN